MFRNTTQDALLHPSTFQWTSTLPLSEPRHIFTTWTLYFTTIVLLKVWMRDRKPPRIMKHICPAYNLLVCALSAFMTCAGVYGVIQNYKAHQSVQALFCLQKTPTQGWLFWTMYLYYISKYLELADTVILILKRRPLIFLHWYHHAIVMLMVWSWLKGANVYSGLGMIANCFVHVLMYWYYFCASIGKRVWFKRYVTTIQIIQFTISFLLSVPYLLYHTSWVQQPCSSSMWVFYFSMVVNGSFLVLFLRFFSRAYAKQ